MNTRKLQKISLRSFLFIFLSLLLVSVVPNAYATATAVSMFTAGNYAVLAGSGITNTGATSINGGDVGSSPTSTETGFGSVTITNGANHTTSDAATIQAKVDLVTAYTQAAAETSDFTISSNLAGQTLTPGVYTSGSSMDISVGGTLTLDAQGNSNAVWVFQTGSTITANTGSSVVIINGGQACNVFWKIGSAATLNANVTFLGTIMAHDDISLLDSVNLNGRLLAGAQGPTGAGAITLIHDTISVPTCSAATSSSSSSSNSNTPAQPPAVCVASEIKGRPRIIESKRISPTSIFISWGPYEGMDSFVIEYGLTNTSWSYNTKVTGFSTILNALPANQAIWVRVAATDNCAIGSYSEGKLVGSPHLPNAGTGQKEIESQFIDFSDMLNMLRPGRAFER
jgi:hypothetical protein